MPRSSASCLFVVPATKAYVDIPTDKLTVGGLASTTEVAITGAKMSEAGCRCIASGRHRAHVPRQEGARWLGLSDIPGVRGFRGRSAGVGMIVVRIVWHPTLSPVTGWATSVTASDMLPGQDSLRWGGKSRR